MRTSSQLHEDLLARCRALGRPPQRARSWIITNEAEALWVVAHGGFLTAKTAKRIWPAETQEEVALRLLKVERPRCSVCQAPLAFGSLATGWKSRSNDTCGRRCAEAHPHRREDRSRRGRHARSFVTNLSAAWSEAARRRRTQTNIDRHGHPTARSAAAEAKRKETLEARYGVSSSFDTPAGTAARARQRQREKMGSVEVLRQRNPLLENVAWDGHLRESRWRCTRCGMVFTDIETSPIRAIRCPACDPPRSSLLQHRFAEALRAQGIEVVTNTRKIIPPLELDIWLPGHGVAVEIDGLYWHSFGAPETKEERLAGLVKVERCQARGARLFIFREDELLARPKVCLSMVLNACGRSVRHQARQLEVRRLSIKEAREFLDQHHLHGAAPAATAYGLLQAGQLLQVATFSRCRFQPGAYELVRLATATGHQVQGGVSRLIRAAGFSRLLSYANRAISGGATYDKIGTLVRQVPPGYSWWKGDRRISRMQAQRRRLPRLLGEQFDPTMTEAENMFAAGWRRIWDSGHLLYDLSGQGARP